VEGRKAGPARSFARTRPGGEEFVSCTAAAARLLQRLRSARLSLAVAESCTGGLLGGRLTEIPGSSDVFLGGVIAYANTAKRDLLGVPEARLERHGAVSASVARAMASGARAQLGASCALSVTGVAGPGGGTRLKPVGLVYIGAALGPKAPVRPRRGWKASPGDAGERIISRRFRFRGDRAEIRRKTVDAAIALLLEALPVRERSRPRTASSGRARPR
jgi:PncC family amidohydrolase